MIWPILLSCIIIFIISATFGLMFGRFPKGLKIGCIVHGEPSNYTAGMLDVLRHYQVDLRPMKSELESRSMVEKGLLDGYFEIGESFVDSLEDMIRHGIGSWTRAGKHHFGQDKVVLHVDSTNRFKADSMLVLMTRGVDILMSTIKTDKKFNHNLYEYVSIEPIYRALDGPDYLASKDIVVIRYFLFAIEQFTIIILMTWTIRESRERMNERLMAAGIKRHQLTLALAVTSSAVIFPIYCVLLASLVPTISFPPIRDWPMATIVVASITICGVAKGILIGQLTNDLGFAAFLHSAYCFSSLFIGYLLWPYEALPEFMKPLVFWFPFTLTGDSMVSSLLKGLPLMNPEVFSGILYAFLYGISSLFFSIWLFRKW